MTRRILVALLLLAPLPAGAYCPTGPFTGEVTYIRDGDTIELGAMAIRFEGIAAPDRGETGYERASAVLSDMVLGKVVTCDLTGKPTYDRCVARCYLDGLDVEAELVRLGYARDCPRYSGGRHHEAELQAAAAGASIDETYALPGYCRPR